MKRQKRAMAVSHGLVDDIREHYDRLSAFYSTLWGEHIHHGYWEDNEPPAAAQEKLVARLAARAGVLRGARVLDVGCGLGGSALWLARNLGCTVTGITISPVQVEIAAERARIENLADRVRFVHMDANHLDLAPESYEVVWVIECSEHIDDKAGLLAACARSLTPGGKFALCAWLAADNRTPEHTQLIAEVCRGMLCPSLANRDEYTGWMEAAGLHAIEVEVITDRVQQTWRHCAAIVERPEVKVMLKLMDSRTRAFVQSFGTIHRAYAVGAMAYGMFTARKR